MLESAARCETGEVVANTGVGGMYHRMVIAAGEVASCAEPGQFLHIRTTAQNDPLLRRPMSIHHFDADRGRVEILYEVVGRGTALLAEKEPGDVLDVMGPLGSGFSKPSGHLCLLVGGGIGVAPLYALALALAPRNRVFLLFGSATQKGSEIAERFRGPCDEVRVATDDGSRGHRGPVTDLLPRVVEEETGPVSVFACGPEPMLAWVAAFSAEYGFECEVSLDRRMGCGVGACLSCVCDLKGEIPHALVCRDGPVFSGEEVLWDEPS